MIIYFDTYTVTFFLSGSMAVTHKLEHKKTNYGVALKWKDTLSMESSKILLFTSNYAN